MPDIVLRQPDGKLALFSTVSGTFVLVDATPEELIDYGAHRAARLAEARAREFYRRAVDDDAQPRRDQINWETALKLNETHGGDLHP